MKSFRTWLPLAMLLIGAHGIASTTPATAQGLGLGGSNDPIEVEADDSLEWLSDRNAYVARGNAVLTQGGDSVRAAVITANYREVPGGEQEIFRLTAEGNVVISSGDNQATGDLAVYEVDSGRFVLTGSEVTLITPTETVTATESLEYYEADQLAVARGDAVVVSGTDRLSADAVAARFQDSPSGDGMELAAMTAEGNVVLVTEADVVHGDRGTWDANLETATVEGNVRLNRGETILNGDKAEIDLATGVSRLQSTGGRVRGLLIPQ